MTTTIVTTSDVPGQAPASSAPDWSLVPFEVGCARCGHDLRGLSDPVCPGCALAFDWSEAVPLEQLTCAACGYNLYGLSETRCPECGEPFEWSEPLARFHRSRLPYFEYRWRDRPVRSFFGTWRRVLRPQRFWRTINLHDPPQPVALLLMACLCVLAVVVVIALGTTLIDVASDLRYYWSWLRRRGVPFDVFGEVFFALHHFLLGLYADLTLTAAIGYGSWLLSSFASLLIFQQSMRRFRVRTVQVVRVWAYAVPMVVPILLFLAFSEVGIEHTRLDLNPSWINPFDMAVGGALVLIAHVVWSLRCAYSCYLDMPHAWGIAVSSQVVAVLSAVLLSDLLSHSHICVELALAFGRRTGAW